MFQFNPTSSDFVALGSLLSTAELLHNHENKSKVDACHWGQWTANRQRDS